MATSFAVDIRPLFCDSPDVDSMQGYGLDLSSYKEVKARAPEIYARLVDGSMPCDESGLQTGWGSSGSGWMRVARRKLCQLPRPTRARPPRVYGTGEG
jgi:hypothetical protein